MVSAPLKAHALSSILPPMTAEEIARASDRVRLFGQREPIEILDGHVIAGWAEYVACVETGVRPTLTKITEPDHLLEYVVRRNVPRHLSSLDRACVAVLAQHHYKELGRERMRAAGRSGGKLKGRGEGRAEVARPFDGERWFETAARLVGSSAGAVRILATIYKNQPDVFAAVRDRRIQMMRDALALARLPDRPSRSEALRRFAAASHEERPPMLRVVFDIERETRLREAPISPAKKGVRYIIHHGLMQKLGAKIADASVDAVHADVLYGDIAMAEYVSVLASRVLVPGGVLALIAGNENCAELLAAVRARLRLVTIGSLVLPGSTCSIRGVTRVDSIPIFFFSRGPRLRHPLSQLAFTSQPTTKAAHPWQKDPSATFELIRAIVPPGSRILDPCCGGGTTGVAALRHGSEFIGVDIDPQAVRASRARLADVERELRAANPGVRRAG